MTRIVLTGSTLSVDTVFPSLARKVEQASQEAKTLRRLKGLFIGASGLLPLLKNCFSR